MKHKLLSTLGVIALVMLALAASPAKAQTTANGPYYANPSWDQQLTCTSTSNCPRFIVLSNWIDTAHPSGGVAVLDRETGLVWETSPSTSTFTWIIAQIHYDTLTVGNRIGWRLPTLQDLASLVDQNVPLPGPTLPSGHPFSNVMQSHYWSATTTAFDASQAWNVFFNFGLIGSGAKDGSSIGPSLAWCVRGGQGVDPQ